MLRLCFGELKGSGRPSNLLRNRRVLVRPATRGALVRQSHNLPARQAAEHLVRIIARYVGLFGVGLLHDFACRRHLRFRHHDPGSGGPPQRILATLEAFAIDLDLDTRIFQRQSNRVRLDWVGRSVNFDELCFSRMHSDPLPAPSFTTRFANRMAA